MAAAIYAEDMYVERAFSEETAAHIRGLRPGSPTSTSTTACAPTATRILGRLIDLARGRA